MRAYVDEIESPAGPLAFAVDERGALVWLNFTQDDYELTAEGELEREGYIPERDPARTASAREQLQEYSAGARYEFELPLALVGSAWQKAVWRALTEIPYGETRSYGEIAALVGRPGAARAVGRANATNRLPLVVPCHRVISADGTLGGFNGGLHIKERLLEHESRVLGENT
ncbi:MAG TPA: methylated-DNA--[protein]-cysteine S-methyltransferase [Rubrobacteraceae bacterium]|nr:methylated-DNA--[protein]-cysteine S-methyltransferase [Rubrobacteraceae bacterium]